MPAMEFAAVDIAYAKVRDAYSAQSSAASESELADQGLLDAKARQEAASAALEPLHNAYLAAVAELNAAVQALTDL